MIRVGSSRGFTMVETIIFLAVSSALFVSAMLLMSGQQAKTEFRQAIGEVQSQVDDVANDVSTGYYSTNGDLNCKVGPLGPPQIVQAPTDNKGTCIFLGRVVQFGVGDSMTLGVYNLAGYRLDSDSKPVTSLPDAVATLMANEGEGYSATTMSGGLTVAKAFYQASVGGAKVPISGVAFTSTLASYNAAAGGLSSGSSTVNVIPITGSVGVNQGGFKSAAESQLRSASPVVNPGGGVHVCLDSGGTNQHVILSIGVEGNLASTLTIRNGKSASDGECR